MPAARRVDRFVDRVVAVDKPEDVGVVAEAAVERVGPAAADQNVVAAEAVQRVVAVQTDQQVVACRAVERVVAGRADDEAQRVVGELQSLDVAQLVRAVDRISTPTSVTVSMPSLVEPNA